MNMKHQHILIDQESHSELQNQLKQTPLTPDHNIRTSHQEASSISIKLNLDVCMGI